MLPYPGPTHFLGHMSLGLTGRLNIGCNFYAWWLGYQPWIPQLGSDSFYPYWCFLCFPPCLTKCWPTCHGILDCSVTIDIFQRDIIFTTIMIFYHWSCVAHPLLDLHSSITGDTWCKLVLPRWTMLAIYLIWLNYLIISLSHPYVSGLIHTWGT